MITQLPRHPVLLVATLHTLIWHGLCSHGTPFRIEGANLVGVIQPSLLLFAPLYMCFYSEHHCPSR